VKQKQLFKNDCVLNTRTYHDDYEHDRSNVSIAGVPFDFFHELHCHLTTADHSYDFSQPLSREVYPCGGFTNKQINKQTNKQTMSSEMDMD